MGGERRARNSDRRGDGAHHTADNTQQRGQALPTLHDLRGVEARGLGLADDVGHPVLDLCAAGAGRLLVLRLDVGGVAAAPELPEALLPAMALARALAFTPALLGSAALVVPGLAPVRLRRAVRRVQDRRGVAARGLDLVADAGRRVRFRALDLHAVGGGRAELRRRPGLGARGAVQGRASAG